MLKVLVILMSIVSYSLSFGHVDTIFKNKVTHELDIDNIIQKKITLKGYGNDILIFKSKEQFKLEADCPQLDYEIDYLNSENEEAFITMVKSFVSSDTGYCLFTINDFLEIEYSYIIDF